MKKLLLTLSVCSGIMSAYAQQIGGNFDNFETGYNSTGVQPVGWKGSNVKQKVYISVSKQMVFEDSGRTNQAVKMVNAWVGYAIFGSNAPSYITLGNPWVYATTNVNNADGGTYGGVDFTYRPDALRGYIKRQLGTEKEEIAQVLVYSWKGSTSINKTVSSSDGKDTKTDLIDRDRDVLGDVLGFNDGASKSEDFGLVSYGAYEVPKNQNISEWTEILVPIEYYNDEIPEKLNVIISSADYFNRGNIGKDNTLWADDFEFVYYSELASLTYNGQDYYVAGNANYTIDAIYDESKLTCTADGKGATIEKSYDEASAVLTITVKGNDVSVNPSNVHTYTVQFAKPQPVVTSYTNSLLVNAFGTYVEPTENTIDLIQEVDGSYSFLLKNFVFGGAPMGDIQIVNLNKMVNGETVVYSAENQMVYIQGLDASVPVTLEATQKGDELTADIHISLGEGADVYVTFLPEMEIDGNSTLNVDPARYNVTMSRSFAEGWSTICLPYATTASALNAQSVQQFESADESGLNFTEVETLEANQPYLIYFDQALSTPVYGVAEVTSTSPVSVTKGDYTFVGSYEDVISMSGKYGIATVDGVQKFMLGGANSTLKATRAFFTKQGEQPAQVRINLFGFGGGEGTTGIDQIENAGAQNYDVYTLQGVQVLKNASSLDGLQKGIYIVNGKKVVIK